jgi:hypothetical protein
MVEPFITYMRAKNFVAPDIERRYYRLFGDLEYDLLALRIETSVMSLRLREVRRRATACIWISAEDERQISVTSHELNEHLYSKLERLHARIAAARGFRYDHQSEAQGRMLLRDIATAVLGIGDADARLRERPTLDEACDAYAKMNVSALIDLHDGVQDLLALERRDALDAEEAREWDDRLEELAASHPYRFAGLLDVPEEITVRADALKRRIARSQERLEMSGMVYTAAIRSMRFRN